MAKAKGGGRSIGSTKSDVHRTGTLYLSTTGNELPRENGGLVRISFAATSCPNQRA